MDIMQVVREVGFYETGRNLLLVGDDEELRDKVSEAMPFPQEAVADGIDALTQWIISFQKNKYLFTTPEIRIIEQLAARVPGQEALILVPCDMDPESRERIGRNLPAEMSVTLLDEPFFPRGFFPGNGMLIACGYLAGERPMVLEETYRLLAHYSGFLGKKLFIPYAVLDEAVRYKGWMEMPADTFTSIWRWDHAQ